MTINLTPSIINEQYTSKKKVRNSNLELYRIVVMILIVAHHYVVNSGLYEVLENEPLNFSSSIMILFGAWGKTGINCFVLITGFFMCKSRYSLTKLLKLYLQILFYALIIYTIFCITGHEVFSIRKILLRLRPVWEFKQNFVSCFLMFYLFIPFINILLNNLEKSQHLILIILLLTYYSILPSFPGFNIDFNYVSWFCAVYIIAAYIRYYQIFPNISHSAWGWISLGLIFVGSVSILLLISIFKLRVLDIPYTPYFFIADSNKILSLTIAVSSFMYFKDLRIPHSRLINAIGGATFGVLLIHANSNAMLIWLWKDTINCVGNFKDDVLWFVGYAVGCVMIIFIICAGIDWFRGRFIEPHLLAGVKKIFSPIQRKFSNLIKISI